MYIFIRLQIIFHYYVNKWCELFGSNSQLTLKFLLIFDHFYKVLLGQPVLEYLDGIEVMSTMSIIGGIGMDSKATEAPCGIKVAKGNGIPDGAFDFFGAVSVYVSNAKGL